MKLASAVRGRADMPSNRTSVMRWVPGFDMLRRYESSWLRHDVVAGLVMTTMLVPVGIAYAEASGLPGINGLYATIVPLLAYALFGPSRILVLGPDSALAAVILAVVLPLSAGDPQRAVPLGGMMAIVSGAVCVGAGLARLGFITELLSKPIRYGYMNGIALTVILSQIPKLFGFSVKADGPLRQAWQIAEKVWGGSTNVTALAIGGGALALILVLKRWPRLPGMLIAVGAATGVVAAFDLGTRTGISVLGPLPQGLPAPRLPLVPIESLGPILTGGLTVALVAFADTQRTLPNLCGAAADTGRPEPGDGGPRHRQRRGRLLSGLPHQQQLFAHAGGGGRGRRRLSSRVSWARSPSHCCWCSRPRCSRICRTPRSRRS